MAETLPNTFRDPSEYLPNPWQNGRDPAESLTKWPRRCRILDKAAQIRRLPSQYLPNTFRVPSEPFATWLNPCRILGSGSGVKRGEKGSILETIFSRFWTIWESVGFEGLQPFLAQKATFSFVILSKLEFCLDFELILTQNLTIWEEDLGWFGGTFGVKWGPTIKPIFAWG